MNLNFYTKTMNRLVSLKKTMVLSIVAILFVGSVSAQLSAGALNFDGINDIINVPLKPELNISKAITIEAWINPTVANVGTRKTEDVISKSTSSVNNGYIFPRTSSGWKTIEFILYINGYGWKALTVPYGTDKIGQWHHLAATYDGIKMVIYIDGAQAGQFAFAGTITTNNNAITIGNQPGYTENFEGTVDEARIWSRALPQCEIANNMSCELTGTQNGLAAYYKFNQGLLNTVNPSETSLIDSSPTGANGTLTNFGLISLLSNWSAGKVSGTCSVFSAPTVTATADKTLIPIGGNIQLHATGGDTYSWTGPNGFTSTDQNPLITAVPTSASGNYTVVATTGGCSGTASVNVTVALMASGLNFDGVTNSVTVPYNAGILNTNAFTIESWIFPTSSNTIIQDVVSNTVFRGTSGVRFPKTNDRWATFSFDLYINGELKTLTANFPTQALGQWNHLAATYDGYYMRVYLNGVIAGTLEVFGTVDVNTNNFTIGNQEGRGEFFKGTVDELRIWSRALSQCEIINNMQTCELNGDNDGIAQQSGLAAYYRFNQGLIGVNNASYNILADSSGHGNNGTLNNFALNGSSSNWVDAKVYGICAYFPLPLLAASANGSAFQTGSDAKLFAVGGNNVYAWTGPSSFQSNAQNPVLTNVQPSNSGTYTVTADYVSCVVTASTRFNVGNVSPIISDGPTAICPSGSVGLSIADAGSTATYQWFKNGVAISGANSFQYVATLAGNYTVNTTIGTDVIVSATTTVTVVPDITAPVADAALSAVNILVGGSVTTIPTATDNCRGAVNGTANRSLTFNTPGTFTITWTYDDLNGNRSTQTQTVNVIDNIAPVLSVPADISVVGTTGICSAVVGFAATATDNSGGAVTITYSQNPNTAFAVGTTTVTVTGTDASNNSSTGSFTVVVTPPAVAPITGNTTICAGASSALASATAGGTWSSDNTAVATINASGVVTAQSLGTATITYTDACGSSVTTLVTVTAIPSTPNITVADNCGSSVLSTDATGTLLWSTNATTPSITVTTAGTYTVTQNLNGCTSAAGTAVAAPISAPAVPSVSVTQPTCSVPTGTLVVNSPAGLSYSIDGINYQLDNTFSGLATGSYTVSVKNGTCVTTSASPVVINAQPVIPAAPVASVTLQPSCSVATGAIVISSPLGFSYSLDGVTYQSGSTFTGVAAGTYTIYAKNGTCVSEGSSPVTVNAQPASPSAPAISVTQPTCAVSTGTIVVTAPAGLSYSLDGVTYQPGTTFTGIATGSYTVYVSNGTCVTTSTSPVVINAQPVTPAAPVAIVTQPTCAVSAGTILISSPAGFTYSLDGVTYQSGSTFTGVAAGTYTLYAKSGTCVSTGISPVTVNAQPASPSAPAVSVTQPTCAVSTGTIVVTAPAGLSYSLDGVTYQPGTTFTGIATGSYTVYVSNGTCVTTSTSPVVINAQPVTPAAPVASVTLQPSCSVATGTIVVSSPLGFTYSLDGVTYQPGTSFTSVSAGTYTVYAKNGTCVSAGSSPVTVNAQPVTPAAPVVSVTAQPTCSVATGTIVVSSPAGFTYSLNGGTYQTSNTFSGVAAGNYTVTAKNGSCVSAVSNIVTVNAQPVTPAAPVVSVTAQPSCSVATGTIVVSSPLGFTYSLDGVTYQSGTTFTGVTAGTYTVSAKSGSCVSVLSNSVTVNAQPATPTAPVVSISQPTCAVATASITISSPVGTGLTYSIDGTNYQAGTSFTGLTANRTYTVYVKNASACVASASAGILAQPATPVVADITGTTNFAVGATSTLSSTTTGGVWSSSNTAVATVNASGVVTGVSIGSATITYTVTTSGCSSSKSAAVTIVSACVTPVFTTITNINTPTINGCTAPVSYAVSVTGNPTLSYTFTGATVASGSGTGSGASFNTGTTTVTVKAVNACSTVTTSFTITVRDATAPSAITKNISVALDGNGQVTIAPSQVDNGSSDNCGTVTLAFRSGSTTSVTTGTICGTADENGNLVLTAPAGGVITSINFASYGTPTGTCGSFVLGACNATTSKTVVEGYALGKNSVTIPATNTVFGDPCVGTYKRLYVQATYQITVSVNATTTVSSLSFGCANKGANTVTLNVTDAAGNVSTQTAVVTVVDNTAPSIVTSVPNQSFCGAAGTYNIPALVATDNCAATVTYTISGATTRSGSGSNASGTFNTGTSVINWTVTDGINSTSSSTTVTVGTTPAGTIIVSNADAFCNKLALTGSSAAVNAAYKWVSPTGSITNNAQLSLGLGDVDGVYQLFVTSNGCSSAATTYNYQKQNTISNYAILGFTQIQLGSNNTVGSGGIGVTSPWGYIGLSSYTNITSQGSFVKAANIGAWGWGINIANPIWSAATGITLPTMYYNTANAAGNPNYNVNPGVTITLNGNYKNLTLKKGSTTVLNGNVFGSITVEQGAQVTFTAATVNIDKLKINKGPRYGYTYVRFSRDTKVLISTNVTVSSNCFINPDNNNVTFYLGDASPDTEKFTVTGGDTRINANVYVPKGILKVTGGYRYGDYGGGFGDCDRDDDDDRYYGQGNSTLYMTGFYIADQVVGYGKNVTWNTFDCSAAPVTVSSNSVQQSTNAAATKETTVTTATSEEELKVTVMPNPSTTYFTLKFESKYETPVNMRVMDASGRVVDAKSKIGSNSTIQIGANYVSGTYYAEMIQGTQRKVVQLMKVK